MSRELGALRRALRGSLSAPADRLPSFLRRLAAALPSGVKGVLEFPLTGAGRTPVDFSLGFDDAELLERIARALGRGGSWARAARLARRWPRGVAAVWLELDTGRGGRRPSVFVDVKNRPRALATMREAARALGASADWKAIARLVRATRRDAAGWQLGFMLGRPGGGWRLCVETESAYVDVDAERLGLELRLRSWARGLRRLRTLGLCDAARARAMLGWRGGTYDGERVLVRRPSHVKLDLLGGGPAKGYLWCATL